MREHGAVGFILCPALGTDRGMMAAVEAWRLPVVTVMRGRRAARATSVMPDNRRGALRAVRHSCGSATGGSPSSAAVPAWSCRRSAAPATARRSRPGAGGLVVESLPSRVGGREALGTVLAMADRPTAVFASTMPSPSGCSTGWPSAGSRPAATSPSSASTMSEAAPWPPRRSPPCASTAAAWARRRPSSCCSKVGTADAPVPDFVGETQLVVRASCGAAQPSRGRRDVA